MIKTYSREELIEMMLEKQEIILDNMNNQDFMKKFKEIFPNANLIFEPNYLNPNNGKYIFEQDDPKDGEVWIETYNSVVYINSVNGKLYALDIELIQYPIKNVTFKKKIANSTEGKKVFLKALQEKMV